MASILITKRDQNTDTHRRMIIYRHGEKTGIYELERDLRGNHRLLASRIVRK